MGRSRLTPEGSHTVTPRITAHREDQRVAFIKDVFAATGEYRAARPCEMKIGDSIVMVSDAGVREPMSAFLYVYVADADLTYRRALGRGAVSLEEPANLPYG